MLRSVMGRRGRTSLAIRCVRVLDLPWYFSILFCLSLASDIVTLILTDLTTESK